MRKGGRQMSRGSVRRSDSGEGNGIGRLREGWRQRAAATKSKTVAPRSPIAADAYPLTARELLPAMADLRPGSEPSYQMSSGKLRPASVGRGQGGRGRVGALQDASSHDGSRVSSGRIADSGGGGRFRNRDGCSISSASESQLWPETSKGASSSELSPDEDEAQPRASDPPQTADPFAALQAQASAEEAPLREASDRASESESSVTFGAAPSDSPE